MRNFSVVKSFGLAIVFLGLTACGGGGGGGGDDESTTTTTTTTSSQSVSGGGVKGPLANAIVTVYAFDPTKPGFKGAAVATATTDASAAIVGLALPFPITPPYILEFTVMPGQPTLLPVSHPSLRRCAPSLRRRCSIPGNRFTQPR